MTDYLPAIILGKVLLIIGILITLNLSACGFQMSTYPVTSASHTDRWEPDDVSCLFGSCDRKNNK